ncbi:MerR family transcriptional regulator [Clostridium sp. ZS2-4]|uniref:MerR family transcriptional regulator n=1 Tax=Clostridium sp. ZS2-4 TaxID=2987703 RepID=UPI00227A5A25|nr:MerR family transcriptional regulator [Clostridium sp. ZS2-4]MCY6354663.1 MerR family transcriptional regulator [Clostridium sp. ZS2-4]
MYTIGEFSRIGKVSTKMLRHYDKIELLKPDYTNPNNGYRYYSKDQIKDVLFVNKLKKYGFSLEEISKVLKKRDSEYLQLVIEQKLLDLTEEIRRSQFILKEMEENIEQLKKGADIMISKRKFDIAIDNLKPMTVLSLRQTISMEDISKLIGKIFENIYKNQLTPAGEIMTIYYDKDFDPENADVEVCIPVNKHLKTAEISTKTVDGGLVAHTTFIGPYSEIGEAYAALMEWVEKNDYEVIRPPFDKYIKGPGAGCSPKEFITEVYFPVEKII